MQDAKERPSGGKFYGFDHIHLWVGNAYQAAGWYVTQFGFEFYAYKGLETGNRSVATHVIRNDHGVLMAFSSPYTKDDEPDMHEHQKNHGDGVKDIAFSVEDSKALFAKALSRGAKAVFEPRELSDEFGTVITSSVYTYGDTIHTFIQRNNYKGFFLPGFAIHPKKKTINQFLPHIGLKVIDHVVGNQPNDEMKPVAEWYEKMLDFHQFWSADESVIHTEFSALRSIVVTDYDEVIKMPINEPAPGKRKSQIQEFVDYYAGPGAQHIALRTENIITDIENMKQRGVEFLDIPDTYYDNLRKNLSHMKVPITENIDLLQKNKILVDYDDQGYLLQIFTKPVEDRPTLFYEVIQRHNHNGFGAGNFKSLFVSMEEAQKLRGNLTDFKPVY